MNVFTLDLSEPRESWSLNDEGNSEDRVIWIHKSTNCHALFVTYRMNIGERERETHSLETYLCNNSHVYLWPTTIYGAASPAFCFRKMNYHFLPSSSSDATKDHEQNVVGGISSFPQVTDMTDSSSNDDDQCCILTSTRHATIIYSNPPGQNPQTPR